MRRRRRVVWTLFLVWTLLVCMALLLPIDLGRTLVGRGFDKVVHTAMFTALGVLAQSALPWLSLVVTIPLAVGLEYAQTWVPQRTFSRVDLYANIVGTLLGAIMAELAWRLRR